MGLCINIVMDNFKIDKKLNALFNDMKKNKAIRFILVGEKKGRVICLKRGKSSKDRKSLARKLAGSFKKKPCIVIYDDEKTNKIVGAIWSPEGADATAKGHNAHLQKTVKDGFSIVIFYQWDNKKAVLDQV